MFALLSLYEFHRVNKNRTEALTDSIMSPHVMSVVKILSVLTVALAAALLTAVLYLPYTVFRMGEVFDLSDYVKSYGVLMLPSLWLAVLATSAFYQIFRRVDLSFLCFAALAFFSMGKWSSDIYLLRWINPLVPVLSSNFSNEVVFRTAGYARLFWFTLFGGLWFISLLYLRNYGKGLFRSFAYNLRKAYLPVMSVLLIAGSYSLFSAEPFIDHAPLVKPDTSGNTGGGLTITTSGGEETENQHLSLLDTRIDVLLDTRRSRLDGTSTYRIENTGGQPQELTLEINPGYTIRNITANGTGVSFTDLQNDHDTNAKDVVFELPADKKIELEITYGGTPKIWSQLRATFRGTVIDPKYIDVSGYSLSPKLAVTAADGAEFSGNVTLPSDLELISTGTPAEVVRENEDGTKTWKVHDARGRISLIGGDYAKLEVEGGGMPVSFYYGKKQQAQLEELGIRKLLEDTLSYCTEHYGLLPYTKETPLNIIMSTAYTFGGGATGNVSFG